VFFLHQFDTSFTFDSCFFFYRSSRSNCYPSFQTFNVARCGETERKKLAGTEQGERNERWSEAAAPGSRERRPAGTTTQITRQPHRPAPTATTTVGRPAGGASSPLLPARHRDYPSREARRNPARRCGRRRSPLWRCGRCRPPPRLRPPRSRLDHALSSSSLAAAITNFFLTAQLGSCWYSKVRVALWSRGYAPNPTPRLVAAVPTRRRPQCECPVRRCNCNKKKPGCPGRARASEASIVYFGTCM
jgi:hypothetical protein